MTDIFSSGQFSVVLSSSIKKENLKGIPLWRVSIISELKLFCSTANTIRCVSVVVAVRSCIDARISESALISFIGQRERTRTSNNLSRNFFNDIGCDALPKSRFPAVECKKSNKQRLWYHSASPDMQIVSETRPLQYECQCTWFTLACLSLVPCLNTPCRHGNSPLQYWCIEIISLSRYKHEKNSSADWLSCVGIMIDSAMAGWHADNFRFVTFVIAPLASQFS